MFSSIKSKSKEYKAARRARLDHLNRTRLLDARALAELGFPPKPDTSGKWSWFKYL